MPRPGEMDFNYVKQSCEDESLLQAAINIGGVDQSGASLQLTNDRTSRDVRLALWANLYINTPVMNPNLDLDLTNVKLH